MQEIKKSDEQEPQEHPIVERPNWLWKCSTCDNDDWELTQMELDEVRAYIDKLEHDLTESLDYRVMLLEIIDGCDRCAKAWTNHRPVNIKTVRNQNIKE